jgi:sugar lactone lactonase YvrE
MPCATPICRATGIGLSALGFLFHVTAAQAQVASTPKVVADAQVALALTASGASISLANPSGIAVAPDGTIYVADTANSRIARISPDSAISERPATRPAKIAATAVFLEPKEGLSRPNAVAVAPDGTLYFSDRGKKALYRVSSPKSDSPVYTELTYAVSESPSALTVDAAGDLWVADAKLKEIIEFAPTATSATKKASVSPMEPTGIAVSSAGLYFTDARTNGVYGQGSKSSLLRGFAGTGFDFAADEAADRPTGLVLDGDGNLFVLDAASKRLVELNPATPSTAFLVPFSGAPSSLAAASTGNLYLTMQQDVTELIYNGNSIDFGKLGNGRTSSAVDLNFAFNADASVTHFFQQLEGKKTGTFSFEGNECLSEEIHAGSVCHAQVRANYGRTMAGLRKGMIGLTNEAEDLLGGVPIAATPSAAVVAFYPGTWTYLSQASPSPTLLEPQGVVVSSSGSDIYVADEGGIETNLQYSYSGAVYDYSQTLPVITKIGASTFQAPSALALDGSGNLWVADYQLGAVYKVNVLNVALITKLTLPPAIVLNHPISLAFDPSGNLYIGDTGPNGFSANAQTPGFIVKVPVSGTATKLNYNVSGAPVIFPQALTTDTAGNLYIADGGDGDVNIGDLVVVPANTGTPALISTGSFTLNQPAGLGFDPALNLYVLDGYNVRALIIPVTLAPTTNVPSFGAARLLNQTLPFGTGSSMYVWQGGQKITFTDIGYPPNPTTYVATLNVQAGNLSLGPIPTGSSVSGSVTAINVGNTTANFTSNSQSGTDTGAYSVTTPVCSGGIAPQGQCAINFTYKPDVIGSTTTQFAFKIGSSPSTTSYVNVNGQSTKASVSSVVLSISSTSLTFDSGTNFQIIVSGNFGVPTGSANLYDNGTLIQSNLQFTSGNGVYYGGFPYGVGALQAGTHNLYAVYSGDSNYAGATSATVVVTVAKANPSLSGFYCNGSNGGVAGGSISCGISISSSTTVQPSGTMNFIVNGVTYPTTISNGSATFTYPNDKHGTYTITGSYPGSTNFNAVSSSPLTVNIN